LDIDSAARNIGIRTNFNRNSQRALSKISKYVDQIALLAQGLGQFKIAVVLDFDTRSILDLNATDRAVLNLGQRPSSDGTVGNGWDNPNVRFAQYEAAIKNLASSMCNAIHWNVMGIDIKDAPQVCTILSALSRASSSS
jgi:endoglucanase